MYNILTVILARKTLPGAAASLDALCKRYRIDNSKRTKHTALIDCELLTKVYINLLDQKEPSLNLTVESDINSETKSLSKIKYYDKIIKPTEQELKLHKDFLKREIKKNYFN